MDGNLRLKFEPCWEDFISILIRNGYTVKIEPIGFSELYEETKYIDIHYEK